MRKSWMLAVALLGLTASMATAAEPVESNVSEASLSALGLGGLNVVSDQQGEQVRGMGFSFTNGLGFALSLNPFAGFSTNDYRTGGGLLSFGTNNSRAGTGFGSGFGFSPFNAFGGGAGLGQFGSGSSGGFGF